MKRLVDETTDELARSLLVAGIEHRPPAGNKAQVIVALGAGGTLGLFSSNAFAWLGTTAGKVTAAGVAVGVASAVFIAGPQLLSSEPAPQASVVSSGAVARGPGATDAVSSGVEREQASAARVADADEAVARGASEDVVSLGAGEAPGSMGDAVTSSASASSKTATKKLATWRERRLAARRRAALAKEAEREGAESAAEVASASEPPPAAPETSGGHDLLAAKADLDSEVKLVDDMHWAARHNDHVALGRFLERYRATFPDGQLKKEVAQFAARLERSTTSPR